MNAYEKQAVDFLTETNTRLTIKPATRPKSPQWDGPHGLHYRVTVSRNGQRIAFDFWDSFAAKERGTVPTPYDVLACVSGDIYCPETFADFCAEYGYDEDSRKAEKTWKGCRTLAAKLRRVFPETKVMESLSEIQ